MQLLDREGRKWISRNLTLGSEVPVQRNDDFQPWAVGWKITDSNETLWSFHVVDPDEDVKLYLALDGDTDTVYLDTEANENRFRL